MRIALLLSMCFLNACEWSASDVEGECGDVHNTPVAVVGLLDAANMRTTGPSLSSYLAASQFVDYEAVSVDETVPIDEYLISARAEITGAELKRSSQRNIPGWFVSTANADCLGPVQQSTQRVIDIDLVSSADLSSDLPAGTSLAGIARIIPHYAAEFGDPIAPITNFPNDPQQSVQLSDYLSVQADAPLRFALRLDTQTDALREHTLTITYTLAGGEIFVVNTDPVVLGPVNQSEPDSLAGSIWELVSYTRDDGSIETLSDSMAGEALIGFNRKLDFLQINVAGSSCDQAVVVSDNAIDSGTSAGNSCAVELGGQSEVENFLFALFDRSVVMYRLDAPGLVITSTRNEIASFSRLR